MSAGLEDHPTFAGFEERFAQGLRQNRISAAHLF